MKFCQHPFCDNYAHVKFCGTSCRVGYNKNHKLRFEALTEFLQDQDRSRDPWETARRALEYYRLSHGYPAKKMPAKS